MKFKKFLFSPVMMGALLVIFAAVMAAATFIENDFGSQAAYGSVYNTKWFELILLLLAVNLIGQLIIFKMFRKEKLPVALFHLAFILMIAGAGITRYFGWEDSIHIREGETSNSCYSSEGYIGYTVNDTNWMQLSEGSFHHTLNPDNAGDYLGQIIYGEKTYELKLEKVIPNATEVIVDDPTGEPLISLVVTNDMINIDRFILLNGSRIYVQGIWIGFNTWEDTEIKISTDSGFFTMTSIYEIGQMNMMTGETLASPPGTSIRLEKMQVISVGDLKIVPKEMSISGIRAPVTAGPGDEPSEYDTYILNISTGGDSETFNLWDKKSGDNDITSCKFDNLEFGITYESKHALLPFSLRLNDFIIERYPGSNSPSGYNSEVTIIDEAENIEKPFSIYMNNVLKYKGYRLYQSSYDKDEQGTILSVSHDPAGMLVTYTGYALLFLFIILSLINRNSLFLTIRAGAWSSPLRKTLATGIFIMLLSGFAPLNAQEFVPSREGAAEFGKVLVQDQKGRTKPLYTMSSDILRKVSREDKFDSYTPMQVFLGIYLDFDNWKNVPMIRVSSKDLQKSLEIRGNMAAFSDMVKMDGNGSYKLSLAVNAAYEKSPGERNKFDKEVMKVDERVNIVYMIYRGDFMKIFPLKDGTINWGSAEEALKNTINREDSLYLERIVTVLSEALQSNSTKEIKQICESVTGYQKRFAGYELPSESKIRAENIYYRMGIFEKLFPFYFTIGILMLLGLISMVIIGKKKKPLIVKILGWLLFAGFLFHTFGLGLRWYLSGHSPMSNGYESMIFISWVTILAGLIFSRKSDFALAATAVLAGMTLMVAHLSFMDPEITNLVPVLKSYWLTLHVSVITGSYGFLGLGAILGIITMILLTLVNDKNRERISKTIDELVVINFKTLTLGLYFLTIGTFLGAVWANEAWGRYWGWDPKETWSLITIIAYTLVIHSRMIPGMKSIYTFNLLSLFAFSSVLMTYFGVNYYLSGLHSYASGDPVPVPAFVYITVIVLVGLCIAAYVKYWKYNRV
ncbi:MAG: c-type cytochrome biogenesis protein CcsB [Bacteroidia bacterium]|nr:c-type cytochrome biogenesis protein CcsB [Bacteroidia bacterium]